MSRTPRARDENTSVSEARRPKSFTRIAPATLKRSLICAFIAALCSICSCAMAPSRRPTRFAGAMKRGSTTSESRVRRHSSANIAVRVKASTTTFDTTEPSVDVTAVWAPTTSLLRREMSAPVWVRVKKATGMRCTLSKRATRRS